MQRTWFALAAVALAATATAACGGSRLEAGARPSTTVLSGAAGSTTLGTVTSSSVAKRELAVPIDSVWQALPAVFDSLKIPVTTVLASEYTMGNEGVKLRRAIAGVNMPNYLNCGGTIGMPNADTYDINLSLITQLQKVEGSDRITNVVTMIDATARPNMGSTINPVACSSTGRLEDRIFRILKLQFRM